VLVIPISDVSNPFSSRSGIPSYSKGDARTDIKLITVDPVIHLLDLVYLNVSHWLASPFKVKEFLPHLFSIGHSHCRRWLQRFQPDRILTFINFCDVLNLLYFTGYDSFVDGRTVVQLCSWSDWWLSITIDSRNWLSVLPLVGQLIIASKMYFRGDLWGSWGSVYCLHLLDVEYTEYWVGKVRWGFRGRLRRELPCFFNNSVELGRGLLVNYFIFIT